MKKIIVLLVIMLFLMMGCKDVETKISTDYSDILDRFPTNTKIVKNLGNNWLLISIKEFGDEICFLTYIEREYSRSSSSITLVPCP